MNELTKRIIVAAIGIPIAVVLIYAGGIIFTAAVIIISALTLSEFYKLTEKKGAKPHKFTGILASVALQSSLYFVFVNSELSSLSFIVLMSLMLLSVIVFSFELWLNHKNSIINTSVTISGILYISFTLGALIGIRNIHNFNWQQLAGVFPDFAIKIRSYQLFEGFDDRWSAGILLSIFATAWISDTTAYFTGKKIGKNKLFPRVSPKKTWEGAITAFISGIIAFLGLTELLSPGFPLIHIIVTGIIISIIGQIGDLAESQLKRDSNVKDSSSVLPGHGGFLDRFDSIIFIAPVVFLYLLASVLF